MITPTTPADPLVDVLAARLRVADLIGWQRVAAWAEEAQLSFEDLRLLLALARSPDNAAVQISEIAALAGFSLDTAFPATHSLRRRGYLVEDDRRYALSPRGLELVAKLDEAHREGIQAYVDQLDPDDRDFLRETLASGRKRP